MSHSLKKEITFSSGVAQLSTTLLGTGLFMIPAIAAGLAAEYSLWAWLLLFIAITPIALTFARLGRQYPNAGGTAYFARLAFNPRVERAIAWLFVSVIPVGLPAAITLAAGFAQQWLPAPLDTPLISQTITVALLLGANLAGSKSSAQIQTVIALGIASLLIAFYMMGDVTVRDITLPPMDSEHLPLIGSAIAVMFWCFVGIEAFAHMGEEFKNPERDFPLAIVVGCFVAAIAYFACSVVILKFNAYGSAQFEHASIPWISDILFGSQASLLISILGFLACFASINLYTQSFARMIWSRARDGQPHSRVAKLSSRGVPVYATLLAVGISYISTVIGQITSFDLAAFLQLANGIFVFVYFIAMLAASRLLTGGYRLLAYFSVVICGAVFVCLGLSMIYAITIFLLLLLPIKVRHKDKSIAV